MLLLAGEHALTNREVGRCCRPPAAAFLEVTSFPELSLRLIDAPARSLMLVCVFVFVQQAHSFHMLSHTSLDPLWRQTQFTRASLRGALVSRAQGRGLHAAEFLAPLDQMVLVTWSLGCWFHRTKTRMI